MGKTACETLDARLDQYATKAAAESGKDFQAAVEVMSRQPQIIAHMFGCSEQDVKMWCHTREWYDD